MNRSYYKQKMCWHDLNCIWVGIVGLASISSSIYLFVRNWSISNCWMKQSCCRFHWEPLCFMMCVCVSSGVMLCVFRSSCSWNALQAHQADAFLFDGSTFQFQLCDCFFQLLLHLVVILLTTEWLQWLHCEYCLLENFVEWQRQAAEPIAYHCAWVSALRISSNPGTLKTGRCYRCCCATAWISAAAALTLRSFVLIWTLHDTADCILQTVCNCLKLLNSRIALIQLYPIPSRFSCIKWLPGTLVQDFRSYAWARCSLIACWRQGGTHMDHFISLMRWLERLPSL